MQKGRVAMAGNSGKWRRLIMAIAAVLYCSLGAFLVTSREGDSSGGREIQLTLTVPAGQTTDPIYRGAIDRFEAENPGVSVKLIPVSSRNYYQKVMVMVAGNCAPDLMWMGQSFDEFADKGLFLDLSRRIRQARIDLNEYKPAVLDWYRRGKRLYSLPFGEDVSFLFYNRRLFREAGVPYPTDDWSLEEFLAAARKLTRRDAEGRVLCYGFRGQLEPGVFGAAPIRISDGEVNCDTPEMREYFRVNLELAHRWRVAPTPEEMQTMNIDVLSSFRQGQVAMMPGFTMNIFQALETFRGMEFDMTRQPKVKCFSQWASSHAICISKDTKYPEEAWKLFLKFQEREFQLPMSHRMLPARSSLVEEALAPSPDRPANYRVLARALAVMAPTPRVPHLQELMAVFSRFSGQVMSRRLLPAEGMRQCAAEMHRRRELFRKTDMESEE